MTSKEECDKSFQYIGYPYFKRVPESELYNKISNHKNKNNSFIIDAQRCNSICSDLDTSLQCDDKLNEYFDRVNSVEICLKDESKLVIELVEKSNTFIPNILMKDGYTYNKLLTLGYQSLTWSELLILFDNDINLKYKLNIPDIINHTSIIYLINPKFMGDFILLSSICTKNLEYTINNIPCKSKCILDYWNYYPIKQYGCFINDIQWDYCISNLE